MSNIKNINGRYYDFGTKNKSFLITAKELKMLGIKNWYFMLEVKNPHMSVQDIDPYDENITAENIARLCIECKQNPWFFFREVAKVPVRGAGKMQPILTRASLAAVWCFDHSIDFILNQPRQTYKSTWCTLILSYMFIFEYQNVEIPMMHIRQDRCLESAEMLRDYICALPPYMNPWSDRNKLPGTKSIKYDQHNVSITVLSQADSEVKAKDKMRGMTILGAMLEEWEYIQYISTVLEGAIPAMISGREIAKQNNVRACIMSLSTPGDLETETGRKALNIINQTPRFSEKLYDLSESDLKKYFDGMSKQDEEGDEQPITSLYIEFNYRQLRKSEKWKEEQHRRAVVNNTMDEYRRGILLQRYRGSDKVLFRQEDIDYIRNHVKEPKYEILLEEKYSLYIYEHEIKHKNINANITYFDTQLPYLIGIDVAAGGNGDNTAFCIMNPYTLEVCGELLSPFIGVVDLMKIIIHLAKLCPKAIFCVETNSIGKAVVDLIQETQIEYRFYHDPKLDISKNAVTKETPEEQMKRKAVEKGYIGTYVTPTIRNNMFDLLKMHVKDYHDLMTTKFLAQDVTNLVRSKTGKIEAGDGFHDDMVMAYNHCIYVLYYGYKLERFGIYKEQFQFQSVKQDLKDYQDEIQDNIVNNVVPYSNPDAFENHLLFDNISSDPMHYMNHEGVDEYGYSRKDYNKIQQLQQARAPEDVTIETSDLSFYSQINEVSMGFSSTPFETINSYF